MKLLWLQIKRRRVSHAEREILDIVERLQNNGEGFAQLNDVLNEAQRKDIDNERAERIIEKLNNVGRFMRPKAMIQSNGCIS